MEVLKNVRAKRVYFLRCIAVETIYGPTSHLHRVVRKQGI